MLRNTALDGSVTDPLLPVVSHVASLFSAQYVPEIFWNSLPPDQLEAWLKDRLPPEMSSSIAKGMETARFKLPEKQALVPAADAYLNAKAPHA